MIKSLLLAFILSAVLSVICYFFIIPVLRKIKVGQPVSNYVAEHKNKNGTPTMGGLVFVVLPTLIYFLLFGYKRLAFLVIAIYFCYFLVGFLDDFIKIKYNKNEGLSPMQKIIFQFAISLVTGIFCLYIGNTKLYIPFTKITVDIGFFMLPLIIFAFVGTVNCVNLIDGIDGLCGTNSLIFLLSILTIIYLQTENFVGYFDSEELKGLIELSMCVVGSIFGFLLFNTNKAKIFMGDTGSLAIGGLICGLTTFSQNLLFIPIFGITFVVTGISVILQVIHYKRTGERLLLIAPLHHHLQKKGYCESKIVFIYAFFSVIVCVVTILASM